MHKDSDTALVNDCRRGDRRAMSRLISQYQRPIFNAAYRIMGNTDDAADVTQIVFLKVFEHIADYDIKFKFFSWIYRIAINESLNQVKSAVNRNPWPITRFHLGEVLMKSWIQVVRVTVFKVR